MSSSSSLRDDDEHDEPSFSSSSSSSDENVTTCVRFRPRNERREATSDFAPIEVNAPNRPNRLTVSFPHDPDRNSQEYDFTHIFRDSASDEEVFQRSTRRLVDGVVHGGIDATVILWGQTGSGKTHTVRGLLDHSIDWLFNLVREGEGRRSFLIQCSMIRLYNGRSMDLMDPVGHRHRQKLFRLREHPLESDVILDPDPNRFCVDSEASAREAFQYGLLQAEIASTRMGSVSSRAIIFRRIRVESLVAGGCSEASDLRVGTLTFVDLAGSERVKKTSASGARLREAMHVGITLGSLSRCVRALADKSRFVPYRDSFVSRLLRRALSGEGRCAWIGTISPTQECFAESLSTIRAIHATRKLVCRPVVRLLSRDRSALVHLLERKPEVTWSPTCMTTSQFRSILEGERPSVDRNFVFVQKEKHDVILDRARKCILRASTHQLMDERIGFVFELLRREVIPKCLVCVHSEAVSSKSLVTVVLCLLN